MPSCCGGESGHMRGRGGGGKSLRRGWTHEGEVRSGGQMLVAERVDTRGSGGGANACGRRDACDNNEGEEGRTNCLGGESACEKDERRSRRSEHKIFVVKRVHARRIRRRREEEGKCLWCRECEKDEGGGEEGKTNGFNGKNYIQEEREEGEEEKRPNICGGQSGHMTGRGGGGQCLWRTEWTEWTHEGEGRRGAMPVAERVDT